jgi:hypothetical protein
MVSRWYRMEWKINKNIIGVMGCAKVCPTITTLTKTKRMEIAQYYVGIGVYFVLIALGYAVYRYAKAVYRKNL